MKPYFVVVEYTSWEGFPDSPWTRAQAYESLDEATKLLEEIVHDHAVWRQEEFPNHAGDSFDFVYADGYIYGHWRDFSEVAVYQKI